ncbi:2OG-Fe(II) oxygenase [Geminocystis sp. GBBB08]|uniref:2OG-Fe(II) oxygenase n=1 Tax=Geminocystis sp. GBBB08 TaxID=2604140 RepID=UPI0027E28404|nr:2OG-Fe(II) oxygenase [Geminocystis sp. GBBB08]MBL1210762.1 redoxin domain-containing protein [Geminocystis sp. GBBB08]
MNRFLRGDPVPLFQCKSTSNPNFHFNTIAGRYVILCFFGSATAENTIKALSFFYQQIRPKFNDSDLCFFGVSVDPQDLELNRVQEIIPGIRFFWDFDLRVSNQYGALETQGDNILYHPFTLILDPSLRVIANISLNDADVHNRTIANIINTLPSVDDYAQVPLTAPILIVPRIFEPEFCRQLINLYNQNGGSESGFMQEKDGKTIGIINNNFKRRQDYEIESEEIRSYMRECLGRRLLPEIKKAFQFEATRIERYIVACYDSESGGFFRPHRDNTTKGTAHRLFAVTINLNAEEYEGGDLCFPEFGRKTYRAPTGGAVVFSCSVLHEATPVTKGTRYATLPFLYNEEAAKIREENLKFLTSQQINVNQE